LDNKVFDITDARCKHEERSTYSECVSVALVIQHAKRMHPIMLSSVACVFLKTFSTLYHKRQDFQEKVIENKQVF